jgi:RNA polymerase sigma-70 factor (ECF subfamily)
MGNTTYLNGVQGARAQRRYASVDEKRLVKRLKGRDETAFNHLVRLHKGLVFNVCLRMLSNSAEAEDIAQDVFVRAFMSISTFREESKLSTWLYRIAVNLCKNRLKYHSRRKSNAHTNIDDMVERSVLSGCGQTTGEADARPDEILEGARTEARIQRALMAVDEDFRRLLVLRDVNGLTYIDIMAITGLPEGTVKSRLHRARSALLRAYELDMKTHRHDKAS